MDIDICQTEPDVLGIGQKSDLHLALLSDSLQKVILKQVRVPHDGNLLSRKAVVFHRLRQYVQLVQALNHPNVGRVLGLSRNYGAVASTVLPFYTKGNVVQHLKNGGSPTDEDKIHLATDIVGGLEYLHAQKITHDNIRAENCLVGDDGKGLLCDAKYKTTMVTDPGVEYVSIDSSCRWTSPERLIPDPLTDTVAGPSKAADMYAVALTIMQLWTLSHPFAHIRRDSAVVIMLQGLIDRNIESIDRPDKVPVAVWACLEDCLNVNPAVRPSAGTLLSRLERMLMNGSADYSL